MLQELCRKRNDTGPTRKRFGKGGVGCSILGNEVCSVGFWHLSHVNPTGIPACFVYSPSSWSCSHALQERHLSWRTPRLQGWDPMCPEPLSYSRCVQRDVGTCVLAASNSSHSVSQPMEFPNVMERRRKKRPLNRLLPAPSFRICSECCNLLFHVLPLLPQMPP